MALLLQRHREEFKEITHSKEHDFVWMDALELPILLHERGLFFSRYHATGVKGLKDGVNGFEEETSDALPLFPLFYLFAAY